MGLCPPSPIQSPYLPRDESWLEGLGHLWPSHPVHTESALSVPVWEGWRGSREAPLLGGQSQYWEASFGPVIWLQTGGPLKYVACGLPPLTLSLHSCTHKSLWNLYSSNIIMVIGRSGIVARSCETPSESLTLSVPQFPQVEYRDNTYLQGCYEG